MRLPALLLAKLMKARIARVFKPAPRLIQCVDPVEVLHPGSPAPVSREKMQSIVESPAPFIWIRRSEPMDHPGIAHFVRAIAQSGHYVFLETNGIILRRRIHEFQPLPQLFLTLRMDALRAPESDLAVEGLRAARLSGFFTVVHSIVRGSSNFAELETLAAFIAENDVDGWLVTAGAADRLVAGKAAEGRSWIASVFWRRFSKLVERQLLLQAKSGEAQAASWTEKPRAETCDESVRIA